MERRRRYLPWLCVVCLTGLIGAIAQESHLPLFAPAWAQNRGAGPLGRIIQRILVPNAINRDKPADDEESKESRGARDRDAIDSRAPQDNKLQGAYRSALAAIGKDKDWATAVDVLQKLLDHDGDSLERNEDGTWTSLKWSATDLLLRAPDDVKKAYIERNAALAEALRKEAKQTGDRNRLTRVATRFMLTPAGQLAADELALANLDRGEYGLASRWHEMLWLSRAEFTDAPAWQLRAALTAKYAGRKEFLIRLTRTWPEWKEPVQIASASIANPQQWLERAHAVIQTIPQALTEQWIPQGPGARVSTSKTSDNVLLPLSANPISSSDSLVQRARTMVEELTESARIPLFTCQPLVVGDRLVVRDLSGVQVYDINTGKSLWQSEMTVVPENIFVETPANTNGVAIPQNFRVNRAAAIRFARNGAMINGSMDDGADTADYHPLGSLLFREGVYNSLSSDGQRLYLIEDQAVITRANPGNHWSMNGNSQDPLGQNWSSNRLTAYDLASGRILWTIGGGGAQDSLGLPLAGAYFHGAPLEDREELLTTCEISGELRLVALDPATGNVRWSQLIGYPDSKIEDDIARRWITNPIAASQGIVVCPTTLGWLVAVDRERHAILWAQRFSTIGETAGMSNQGGELLTMQPLGSEWQGSIPSIVGDSVIYAPAESQHIFCFDLLSGRQRWKTARGEHVFVGGVTAQSVILVKPRGLTAINLADGESQWSIDLPEADLVAGRGVLGNGEYLVPSQKGRIYTVNLKDGGVTGTRRTSEEGYQLGNLVAAGERLVSFSIDGLVVYTSRPQLARWLEGAPGATPQAHVLRAQLALLERRTAEARRGLDAALGALDPAWIRQALPLQAGSDSAKPSSPPAPLSQRTSTTEKNETATFPLDIEQFRKVVWTISLARLREGGFDTVDLDRLARAARTMDDRGLAAAHRLRALSRQPANDEFIDELLEFAQNYSENLFPDDTTPAIRLTGKTWARGLLQQITGMSQASGKTADDEGSALAQSPPEAKAWSDLVERRLKQMNPSQSAPDGTPPGPDSSTLLSVADFHPAARDQALSLVDQLIDRGTYHEAELRLLRMLSAGGNTDRGALNDRLVRIAQAIGAEEDLPLIRTGTTLAGMIPAVAPTPPATQEPAPKTEPSTITSPQAPTPPTPWGMETMGTSSYQQMQTGSLSSAFPSISNLRYEIDHQAQRISLSNRQKPERSWRPPLSGSRQRGNQHTVALTVGHSVYVMHQQVLSLLAPLEKKTAWSQPLEETGPNGKSGHRPSPAALIDTENNMVSLLSSEELNARGRFAGASAGGIVLYGKRSLDVFDPITGELKWQRQNISAEARVIVLDQFVVIYSYDRSKMTIHQLDNGREIPTEWEEERLHHAIGTVGDTFLMYDGNISRNLFGFTSGKCTLKREHPVTKEIVWKLSLPAGAGLREITDGTWFISNPAGDAMLLDATTGKTQPLGAIPLSARGNYRGERFVSCDNERIYLVLNDTKYSDARFSDSLASHRASGEIFAWDKATGKLLWNTKIANQQLAIDSVADAPVLVFASRSWKQKADVHYSMLWIDVIDKATGTSLFSQSRPFASSGLHSFGVTADGKKVDLSTYNMKLRLGPKEASAANSAPIQPGTGPEQPALVPKPAS
ncbi:MAG: hypothetical protein C0478_06335 [Planctomyces sp.]|nr:hypothetical protein [Planctomyces sp.]